ncbi:MAG TPA: exopolysaccharide biosynthesis protein [Methylomirabilota bacterium]|nr:exopolysaccharide biosynthesis protein [Methylomirabilota bacterium]
MEKPRQPQVFSKELEKWLKSGHDTTLAGLTKLFEEKSFAIIFLLLMALPALPIPTGGLTHVTELITMLVCLQLIVGRKTVWLPKKWLKIDVGKRLSDKSAKKLVSVIEKFENLSRQRWSGLLAQSWMLSLLGVIIFILTLAAFVAPPFSGLDTLPALGVVSISLALILEDSLIVLVGIIIGVLGIALEIAAGTALYSGITHFL